MSADHSGGRSSRAVHVVLASLLLVACEGGDMLDQSVLVGEWSGPMRDGTPYTMTLQPEGDGATTVIAGDTTRFAVWWYGYDRSDGEVDGSDRAIDSSATFPELCLVREDDSIRCHVVHSLRADTLNMTEHGGGHLRLLRTGGAPPDSTVRDTTARDTTPP